MKWNLKFKYDRSSSDLGYWALIALGWIKNTEQRAVRLVVLNCEVKIGKFLVVT